MRPDWERGRTEEKLTNMLQLCPLLQSANFAPGPHNSGSRLFGAIAIHVKTHFWSLLKLKCAQRNMQIKVLIEMNTEHQSFPIKNGLYLIVAITSFYNNYKAKTLGQEGKSFARLVACETEISSAYLDIGPFSSIVALTIINAFERLQARKGKNDIDERAIRNKFISIGKPLNCKQSNR